VRARRVGDKLEIEIADDGPGLPPVPAERRREGIGLTNTRARLSKLYGEAHRLVLEDRPEGGTRLIVELPYREVVGKAPASDEPLELLEELPHAAGLHR